MQFRVLTALIIFMGSYLPLSLILLAQNFDYAYLAKPFCWGSSIVNCSLPFKNPGFALGVFVACSLCFIVTLGALWLTQPKDEVIIHEVKHIPADLMNYTLPYIVSFMSIDYQDAGKYIGVVIFLGWMFWITYKSGQTILNPVLIAFGWKLYEVSYNYAGSTSVHTANALARGHIAPGDRLRQIPLQEILIIKPNT